MKEACKQKEIAGCEDCQYHAYWGCNRTVPTDESAKCGFDEKKPCNRKCIYFDTCTRNPNKKKKEKSLH